MILGKLLSGVLTDIGYRDTVAWTDGGVDVPLATLPAALGPYQYDSVNLLAVPSLAGAQAVQIGVLQQQANGWIASQYSSATLASILAGYQLAQVTNNATAVATLQPVVTWVQAVEAALETAIAAVNAAGTVAAVYAINVSLPTPPTLVTTVPAITLHGNGTLPQNLTYSDGSPLMSIPPTSPALLYPTTNILLANDSGMQYTSGEILIDATDNLWLSTLGAGAGQLIDSNGSAGTAGYVLTSNGAGVGATWQAGGGGGGSGTVTTVSVVSANGFSGSVANPTTTPAITLSIGASLNVNTHQIINVVDPTTAQMAATKNYVDMAVAALAPKNDCQGATTTALAASTYNNGTAGVGATLTLTVAAVLVLDGYTPALGDRLLIKNQASAVQNGIYTLTTVGTVLVSAVLTRTTDFDQPGDGINGALVYVLNGTVNGNTLWTCTTAASVTFGTTNINWSQFTGTTYTADNTTLTLTGTTFSIKNGPTRVLLSGSTTFYVTPSTGNDSNTPQQAQTSATGWATIQGAINNLYAQVDSGGQAVTVQLANGTYTVGATVTGPLPGGGTLTFNGSATPGNVVLAPTSSVACFFAQNGAQVTVQNMDITPATGLYGLLSSFQSNIQFVTVRFGATSGGIHMGADNNSSLYGLGNYSIIGGAGSHIQCNGTGYIYFTPATVTLTGTPAFSSYFATLTGNSTLIIPGMTFSGSATGVRYLTVAGSLIQTNGAGATYLPGNSNGSTATGGQYL